jgi:hypothetical protein
MKKLAFLIAILVAAAAAVPASGAVLRAASCGKSCSSLHATGNGWLSVVGSGAEYGTISSGTLWVRDRSDNRHKDFSVTGFQTRVSIGDDGWKFTSKHAMSFCANSKFWVKLQGPGIAVNGVFDGSGEIAGTGNYMLDNGRHAWPKHAADLHF